MRNLASSLLVGLLLVLGAPASAQQLTPKEMLDSSRAALEEMADAENAVAKDLDVAERKGDPDTLSCVQAKLASVRTLSQVSNLAMSSMTEALASDATERAGHEYRKINVALGRVRQFKAESAACLGDEGLADSTTEVQYDGDDSGTDETQGPGDSDGVVGVDPPGTTSFE